MSSNLAYALPAHAPRTPQRERHIEIVSTRSQRRARPKAIYAVVTISAVFALFLGQLVLSIVLSDGAYQISALQAEQKELGRTEQALTESLDLLGSPQNLATQAESLGMVVNNTAPRFLQLSDGAVLGATAGPSKYLGVLGGTAGLVPNSLLDPAAPTAAAAAATAAAAGAVGGVITAESPAVNLSDAGAPAPTTAAGSVASTPGSLPSPVTR